MYYIVALGNPGEKYQHTRHNIGWSSLDHCISEWKLSALVESAATSGMITRGVVCGNDVSVLYPTTFMNNSGSAIAKFLAKEEIGQLIVVHDDIDLPFGDIKVVKGRGSGGNKGVQSIIDRLGSNDFVRVRVGIAPRSFWTGKIKRPQGGGPLERFVLKPFTTREQKELEPIIEKVRGALETIITSGVTKPMNELN